MLNVASSTRRQHHSLSVRKDGLITEPSLKYVRHLFSQEYYSETCVLCLTGPQIVVLYDRWSFIGGTNIEKCSPTFLLKGSYMTGDLSLQWSYIWYLILERNNLCQHNGHCLPLLFLSTKGVLYDR